MIHGTKKGKPYGGRDIFNSRDKSNKRLTNVENFLEKDDSTAILSENTLQGNYESIIGRSPQILEVLKQIDKVANTMQLRTVTSRRLLIMALSAKTFTID